LQQQIGTQELGIFARELFPAAAVAAFDDMLLNQCKVGDRYGFMIPLCFAEVPGVIADRVAHARQCRDEFACDKIQVRRAHVRQVPEFAFRQHALL
jgi:hypothetical protein